MSSLYKLTDEMERLQAALASDLTDEEWVVLMNEIVFAEGAIAEKLDGYAKVIRNMQAESDAYKAEETRLAALRKPIDKTIERMKNAVETAMRTSNETKVKTTIGTWSIQKNPPSVNVTDESKVPADYWIEQKPTLDRRAILEKLKAKEEVPGAELTQGESLRFR